MIGRFTAMLIRGAHKGIGDTVNILEKGLRIVGSRFKIEGQMRKDSTKGSSRNKFSTENCQIYGKYPSYNSKF